MRMGIGSLIVSVRLNDSTYSASSVSAHLFAFESAQTCALTHSHTHPYIITKSYLLLVLIISTFVFILCPILLLFEPDWTCDFMTHCPCICAVSLWLHAAMLQSVLSSNPVFMDKGCPGFQSPWYVEALSFQRKTMPRRRLHDDGVGNENI